jgi:hypothetical protein
MLWNSLADYDTWPIYLIGLSWTIPMTPENNLHHAKALGFNTFQTNLLTIPTYVLFILQLLFRTWVSEKINQRMVVALISQIWVLPLIIAFDVLLTRFHGSN